MPPPHIIAFLGESLSGKSYATRIAHKYLVHILETPSKTYAFADPLKRLCQAAFGFSDAQLWGHLKDVIDPRYKQTPRHFLQKIGTEWFRNRFHMDLGVELLHSLWIERFLQFADHEYRVQGTKVIAIEDCRFPDEAQALLTLDPDAQLILVEDKTAALPNPGTTQHASEDVKGLIASLSEEQRRKNLIVIENFKTPQFHVDIIQALHASKPSPPQLLPSPPGTQT